SPQPGQAHQPLDARLGGRSLSPTWLDPPATDRRGYPHRPEAAGDPLAAGQALDHQPRSGVRAKKKARDRLIPLAATHPDWVLGYLDETWGSRLAHPPLHAWTAAEPLRLVELTADRTDPDPKALSCYGLLRDDTGQMLLRFVQGRPVSQVTEDYLAWV